MGRVVGATRFLFVAAVAALLVLAALLIIYGTVTVFQSVVDLFTDPEFNTAGTKEITLEAIEIVDIFLLGIAVFILGTGIYTLFIDSVGLPDAMRVGSLGEMKAILASTIIVVIGVGYLGVLFRDGDPLDKGLVGLGAAAVIAALTFYVRSSKGH